MTPTTQAKHAREAVTLEEYVTAVEQQRDALAEALRELVRVQVEGSIGELRRATDHARAALAKVTP